MLTFSFYKHRWWQQASALSVGGSGGATSTAKSYPTSEVRDNGPECQAVTAQEWPGGVTLRPRSGAAGRSHIAPEAKGGDPEEPPRARCGSWEEPPTPEARACGWEEHPEDAQAQEGLEEPR